MGVDRILDVGRDLRLFLNKIVDLVNELRTDHATAKTLQDELVADHATFKSAVDETKTELGNLCLSPAGLTIGSGDAAKIKIANTVDYTIGGIFKQKTTAEVALTPTTHDITDGSEKVFVVSLDGSGTATITGGTEAVGSGNATIPDGPAGECVIGHVRVFTTGAGFTAGTTLLSAAEVTDTYTDVSHLPQQITAAPATLTAAAQATVTAVAADNLRD